MVKLPVEIKLQCDPVVVEQKFNLLRQDGRTQRTFAHVAHVKNPWPFENREEKAELATGLAKM